MLESLGLFYLFIFKKIKAEPQFEQSQDKPLI